MCVQSTRSVVSEDAEEAITHARTRAHTHTHTYTQTHTHIQPRTCKGNLALGVSSSHCVSHGTVHLALSLSLCVSLNPSAQI